MPSSPASSTGSTSSGSPWAGVVVNGLIPKETVKADSPEFVRNRVKMQDEHMEEIWKIFGDGVRSIVPLFETEVQGPVMLRRLADKLFV